MRTRPPRPIDLADQARLLAALQRWPARHGFVGYRTRAFVLLLWDGALRTGAALNLNAEEVVVDPRDATIAVVDNTLLPARGPRGQTTRRLAMSERVRAAIGDYLEVARAGGFLAERASVRGPLFIARHPHGGQRRMSRRTAMVAWKTFLDTVSGLCCRDYQLDDLVLTGRVAFFEAANGSSRALSKHTGISLGAAGLYTQHLRGPSGSPNDVLLRLDEHRRRRGEAP